MSEDKPENKGPTNGSQKSSQNGPPNSPQNSKDNGLVQNEANSKASSETSPEAKSHNVGASSNSSSLSKSSPEGDSKAARLENLEGHNTPEAGEVSENSKTPETPETPENGGPHKFEKTITSSKTSKAESQNAKPQVASAPKPASKLKEKLGRWYFIALGVAFLAIIVLGVQSYCFLKYPAQAEGKMVVVEINPGDSFDKVATRLESAGAISSKFKFKLYAKLRGEDSQIQAGVFEFYTNWTPAEVLYQLVYGKPTLERFTLREGLPWWEVAKRVEQAGLAKAEDFKEIIHDPDFLREMGIPFKSAEGFLYPETYFLRKPPEVLDKAQARQIATRLINTFWQKSATVWGDVKPTGEELKTLLILASLVEKETGVASERARVAGVYANRLRLNMLLQCDPTTIYGLGETFNGNLRRKHLQDPANLYNTYQHAGLPPGPICSPGAAALQAALEPEEHKYLYFVATGKNGSHYFNTNLKDHNRDVAKYIAELRKARQAGNQPKPANEQVAQTNSTASTASQVVSMNATASGATANANNTNANNANANTANASRQEPGLEILEEELKLSQNATPSAPTPNNAPGDNAGVSKAFTNSTLGEGSSPLPAQNATLGSKPATNAYGQNATDQHVPALNSPPQNATLP